MIIVTRPNPLVLVILDGFGLRDEKQGNAVAQANKENYDRLVMEYPNTRLGASGLSVGLPDGQMGNSEVGHLNIGSGRIVYQDLTRVTKSPSPLAKAITSNLSASSNISITMPTSQFPFA